MWRAGFIFGSIEALEIFAIFKWFLYDLEVIENAIFDTGSRADFRLISRILM